MSEAIDGVERPDETICWQCGARADPACAHPETLGAWGSGHETPGYPVTRGPAQEALRLTIPRCRSCARRGLVIGLLALAGAAIGIVVAGIASDWHGGSAFVGFILGSFVITFAGITYERRNGRRVLTDYPPLRYLLRHGWHIQGSA